MQALLGACGLLTFFLMYFLFPETSQPGARGIDKLALEERAKFIFINPLRPLALLRSPNILLIVRGFDDLRCYTKFLPWNEISQSYCPSP